MLTEEQILKSIQAKSDQLNAVDLVAGPIDVTIDSVSQGAVDQPWVMKLKGDYQPYKPCKTMRRVIVAAWGTKPQQWIGRGLRLFCDPSVKWGGAEVGGIRISHMSHIEKCVTVQVNETRGKKVSITVEPLVVDTDSRVAQCIERLRKCTTKEAVEKTFSLAAKLLEVCSDEQKLLIEAARDDVLEVLK